MEIPFSSRLKAAWNLFLNRDPTPYLGYDLGPSYSRRPDRPRFTKGNEQTISSSIFNRIALDVASIDYRHVRLDKDDRFLEEMNSDLNNCLKLEANVDQNAMSFIMDIVMSAMDDGVVAVVPVDTKSNPMTGSFDITTMRTGKILEWKPRHVKVKVYNDNSGLYEEKIVPKSMVAIIENPLYPVINEPNSTLQRLIRKLRLLDIVDEQSSSGKLDLIIQLPYTVKTKTRQDQADMRKKNIEDQIRNSPLGIAYIDATEKVTQLNRPIENNLMKTIEYLTSMLYSQLGITQEIMNGTANETTMLNYHNRSVEPWVTTILLEYKRKFLSKTARTQKQSILAFRDPFKLSPIGQIAEIADKMTRNEIMTTNEVRQKIGMKPSKDPKADELRNKNLSEPTGGPQEEYPTVPVEYEEYAEQEEYQNG